MSRKSCWTVRYGIPRIIAIIILSTSLIPFQLLRTTHPSLKSERIAEKRPDRSPLPFWGFLPSLRTGGLTMASHGVEFEDASSAADEYHLLHDGGGRDAIADASDDSRLKQLGYKQELRRSLSYVTNQLLPPPPQPLSLRLLLKLGVNPWRCDRFLDESFDLGLMLLSGDASLHVCFYFLLGAEMIEYAWVILLKYMFSVILLCWVWFLVALRKSLFEPFVYCLTSCLNFFIDFIFFSIFLSNRAISVMDFQLVFDQVLVLFQSIQCRPCGFEQGDRQLLRDFLHNIGTHGSHHHIWDGAYLWRTLDHDLRLAVRGHDDHACRSLNGRDLFRFPDLRRPLLLERQALRDWVGPPRFVVHGLVRH